MSNIKEEPFLNDLSLSLQQAWRILREGAADRRSPLHTPSVATVTRAGAPSQRIMVLRAVDEDRRRLRFHSDLRGSKVTEIGHQGGISVLGYHPDAKVQLRLSGNAVVQSNGAEADAAWEQSSLYGQRCYLAEPGPGSAVDGPTSGIHPAIEGVKPTAEQVSPARANFAILRVEVQAIEWLYLAHRGHRRALFHWDAAANRWDGSWLVP